MNDKTVLTKEEVDALLNVGNSQGVSLNSFPSNGEVNEMEWKEEIQSINQRSLKNIMELTAVELEGIATTYLRKKIETKSKEIKYDILSECIKDRMEKHIYCIFEIQPLNHHGMIAISYTFLHHMINLLYGGKLTAEDPVTQSPGKIGLAVAEKIFVLGLESLKKACSEYGEITCNILKTSTHPGLSSKLSMDDKVQMLDIAFQIKDIENIMTVLIQTEFFTHFIPTAKLDPGKPVERNFWRTAIETQVSDTYVTLNVSLSDIKMKVKDLVSLKEGDTIPISDPTNVYVCLNQVKLYRGVAGQSNATRVAKITGEI